MVGAYLHCNSPLLGPSAGRPDCSKSVHSGRRRLGPGDVMRVKGPPQLKRLYLATDLDIESSEFLTGRVGPSFEPVPAGFSRMDW